VEERALAPRAISPRHNPSVATPYPKDAAPQWALPRPRDRKCASAVGREPIVGGLPLPETATCLSHVAGRRRGSGEQLGSLARAPWPRLNVGDARSGSKQAPVRRPPAAAMDRAQAAGPVEACSWRESPPFQRGKYRVRLADARCASATWSPRVAGARTPGHISYAAASQHLAAKS